jgi:adenosyl cobinamide kinase/adenosyl cobinamide phosphate guanylyltransferase
LITDGTPTGFGTASGSRLFAESIAARLEGRTVYVETAEFLDDIDEPMENPDNWHETVLAPRDLIGALALELDARTVLVDGLGQWVANRLLDLGDPDEGQWGDEVAALGSMLVDEAKDVLRLARAAGWTLILVSNEPPSEVAAPANQPLGRAFGEIIRDLNRAIGAVADGVFAVVAGIPVELKRPQAVVV